LLWLGLVVEAEAREIEAGNLSAAPAGKTGEKDGGDVAHWLGDCRSAAAETFKTHHDTHLYCQPSINP
jgi:hypothetical protein